MQPSGLYLYGDVGCGKTMLLDLFYSTTPVFSKTRVHWHSFLLRLYSEMNRFHLQGCPSVDTLPTDYIASRLMEDAWLFCFDEVQFSDYASTGLLSSVLGSMLRRGAVVVATSNRHPDQLGASSLTEERHLDLANKSLLGGLRGIIKTHCEVYHLESTSDFRYLLGSGEQVYFVTSSRSAVEHFNQAFALKVGPSLLTVLWLVVYGRHVQVPLCTDAGVAKFSFKELCGIPLAAADYIAICNHFEYIFVDGIPELTMIVKDEARRFITFVDCAYESHVKLYCLASRPLEQLFKLILPQTDVSEEEDQMKLEMFGNLVYDMSLIRFNMIGAGFVSGRDELFSYRRAVSRLCEMQSAAYQQQPHRKQAFSPFVGTPEQRRAAAMENRRLKIYSSGEGDIKNASDSHPLVAPNPAKMADPERHIWGLGWLEKRFLKKPKWFKGEVYNKTPS